MCPTIKFLPYFRTILASRLLDSSCISAYNIYAMISLYYIGSGLAHFLK